MLSPLQGQGGGTWLGQAKRAPGCRGEAAASVPSSGCGLSHPPWMWGKGLDSLPCMSEREAEPEAEWTRRPRRSAVPAVLAGQQEPGRHFSDLQQKSLSFLQALKVCPTPAVSLQAFSV